MEKRSKLKDGREVRIREMRPGDKEKSLAFFRGLPDDDRRYLRRDVTRPELVERRIRDIQSGRVIRIVALIGDEIVGDGSLELEGHGWGEHVAEIRLIVSHELQRNGLGTLLARRLYLLANRHKTERIVARFLAPQEGARRILRRLGFHDEFRIPAQAQDQDGGWQDMVIMRCSLVELWREMERLVLDMDFQNQWPRPVLPSLTVGSSSKVTVE